MQNQLLPPETWLEILKHVSTKQLHAVATTCKDFNNWTSANSYLWQTKFIETFGHVVKPLHVSWKDFYTNYAVTWSFGENNFGNLGQGQTALTKLDYNKTCIEQVFVAVAVFEYCTAFFDQESRVWLSGMLPNGSFTNSPLLLIQKSVKQVIAFPRDVLYINTYNQLCDQNDRVLINEVKSVSSTHCINSAGDVCTYTYNNQQLQVHVIAAPCKMLKVKHNYFQDVHGCLWHHSNGHWTQLLLNEQHVSVRDFSVHNKRIAVLDQEGHFWLNYNGHFECISTQEFKQVATGINHTLALDIAGHVWAIGKNNNYGQLGPIKSDQLERISGITASSIAAGRNSSIIIGQTF